MSTNLTNADWLQLCLQRHNSGDDQAISELLVHCGDRLRILARRMLKSFRKVARWRDTDDILQNGMLRLLGALKSVKPKTLPEFFGLAALQMRRELIDLARAFSRPNSFEANHQTDSPGCRQQFFPGSQRNKDLGKPAEMQPCSSGEPGSLEDWIHFHELVETLPVEQRQVADMIFYQGMVVDEISIALQLPPRTIRRRWLAARLSLAKSLRGIDLS